MAALLFILISLISVSHAQSTPNCNSIEAVFKGEIDENTYNVTSAFPAGVCAGSRVSDAEGGNPIESSSFFQCINGQMYIKTFLNTFECEGAPSSTILASSVYQQATIECNAEDCNYTRVRMLTGTIDDNCQPLSAVYATSYWVDAVFIEDYCHTYYISVLGSYSSSKAECGVKSANYTIYSNDQVCSGASTTVVNYDDGCKFDVKCDRANSTCNGCTTPNTGGQKGVCNINANSFRLIYDNTQFRYEGECLNPQSTTNGKFTIFKLELINATDGATTINCDNAKWDNPSGSDQNTLRCNDKIDWYLKVDKKTIKFAVIVSNWAAEDGESPLKVCFTASSLFCKIKNGATYLDCESSNGEPQGDEEFKIGEYRFKNEKEATCGGDPDNVLTVIPTASVLDGNENEDTISMCYEFAYCESGNIDYDPFVYYEGDNSTDDSTYSTTIATITTTIAATTTTINENTNPNINVATMASFNYYSIFMYMTAVIYYYNQHTI